MKRDRPLSGEWATEREEKEEGRQRNMDEVTFFYRKQSPPKVPRAPRPPLPGERVILAGFLRAPPLLSSILHPEQTRGTGGRERSGKKIGNEVAELWREEWKKNRERSGRALERGVEKK
eukprot:Hpha_TRINITY_DN14251_c0_g1::TRINITY_DN14251_c0_g1_i1::g.22662::m.22662